LPMRAIVNGHHVQPRRNLLDALGYSDLSPQAAEEVDRLNRQLLQKTSLQTECTLEMTRHVAGCRGRRDKFPHAAGPFAENGDHLRAARGKAVEPVLEHVIVVTAQHFHVSDPEAACSFAARTSESEGV
jgi:hypothetical protein